MTEMAIEQNQEDIQAKLIIPEEKYNQLLAMSETLSTKLATFMAKRDELKQTMKEILERAKEARIKHEEFTCKRYLLLYKKRQDDMERFSKMIMHLSSIQSMLNKHLSVCTLQTVLDHNDEVIQELGIEQIDPTIVLERTEQILEMQEQLAEYINQMGEGEGKDNVEQDVADEKMKELPQVNTSMPTNCKSEEKADLQAPLLAE